jgi:CRISPR-associated endonuclease/helicase Cas3
LKDAAQRDQEILARFRKEFEPLYGGQPFPWQERLFLQFCAGEIPSALDLPTGLGKTSVMTIWLIARALAPDSARKDIPRRLVYVVDRRAVVDQATIEAEKLRSWLDESAVNLKPELQLDRSLPISTLRGRRADNREWLENPAGCAIVVGTVDMIGSRLLFSGYGVSPNMRPYHAGFLGADTLIVLDESHLVPPFEALLRAIENGTHPEFGPKLDEQRKIVPEFSVMCLSATGTNPPNTERVFSLMDEDYKHEIVRKRLRAPKHLTIGEEATNETLAERLAARAWALATDPVPSRVIVYCERREEALIVRDEIHKHAGRKLKSLELLVGERRVYEREALFDWLEKNGFVADVPCPPETPTILVATSAGEVGVDLDADHMVCDLVAWERMVQRLGRVNRRGGKQSRIEVIPASPKDRKKDAEDWEKRAPDLLAPLSRLPDFDGGRNASPGAIAQLRSKPELQGLLQKAQSPEPLHPALSRALVDAWSLTSVEHHTGRPDIQPWLRGWVEDEPRSTIVWRKFLPLRKGEEASKQEINEFFEAAPPHVSELLETETWRAVDWIIARAMATAKAARGLKQDGPEENAVVLLMVDRKGRFEEAYSIAKLAELERKEKRKDRDGFEQRIAGRMLVVSSRLGGLDREGMLSNAIAEYAPTVEESETWAEAANFRVRETTEPLPIKDKKWKEFYRFATEHADDGIELRWIVVEQLQAQGQTEESLAVARNEQALDEHQRQVAAAARKVAHALGLPSPYAEMLVLVAKIHDEGKNTNRWQRAFHAPPDKVCAKTKGPVNIRLLDGYRHEFGSLICAERNTELRALPTDVRDLAFHLIAAHHGNARPMISPRSYDAGAPSRLQGAACEAAVRFGRLQKQWGPWGLAWWEALLRSIDQHVSRKNDEADSLASEEVKAAETV